VSVRTEYKGASAEIIESQVTQVLESSIAGIEGIEILSSSSRPEESRITVRFRLGISPDSAASDVRDRVGRVRGRRAAQLLVRLDRPKSGLPPLDVRQPHDLRADRPGEGGIGGRGPQHPLGEGGILDRTARQILRRATAGGEQDADRDQDAG
jgi:hypothetical protein